MLLDLVHGVVSLCSLSLLVWVSCCSLYTRWGELMLPNRRSELEESGTPSFWLTLAPLPCQLGHE